MQTEALNWLIKTGEWDTLQQADIDERYFGDVIPQFQWIRDFIKEHRKVPSLTTFLYQWPDWEYVPYDEPASFVIEGLRNDLLYRETFHTIKKRRTTPEREARGGSQTTSNGCRKAGKNPIRERGCDS